MQDRDMTGMTAAVERPLVQQLLLDIGLAATFTAAIVAGAHLKIPLPFTPVPLTLQTLVVLLAGGLLGARLGFVATTGFLLVGLIAPGTLAGPSFLGPTGGYIVGFILAAVIMGMATRRGGWLWPIVGAASGSLVILLCGSLWLVAYTGQDWLKAVQFGLLPFLAGDAIKTAAAVAGVRLFGRQMQRLLG